MEKSGMDKILVVDDNQEITDLIENILKKKDLKL